MRCRKWAVEISKWHEGELSSKEQAELLRHLEGCSHCQGMEARFRAVSDLLNEAPELPVPDFLAQRIAASISEKMRHTTGSRLSRLFDFLSYRHWAAVIAGMLIIGVCIGGFAGRDLARIAKVSPARPPYDLLTLGEIGNRSRSMDYSVIWQDNGGSRP